MPASVATDVADMRRAVALEKGEDDIWDLKYAAGGLVDIDFIAQYLQLVHAADKPDILDVSTLQVLDNAARLGVLPAASVEILRTAARLYHDLTQILRLCVTGKFKPDAAGEDLQRVMARAGDAPDFSSLEARVKETQAEVRRVFRGASVENRASAGIRSRTLSSARTARICTGTDLYEAFRISRHNDRARSAHWPRDNRPPPSLPRSCRRRRSTRA